MSHNEPEWPWLLTRLPSPEPKPSNAPSFPRHWTLQPVAAVAVCGTFWGSTTSKADFFPKKFALGLGLQGRTWEQSTLESSKLCNCEISLPSGPFCVQHVLSGKSSLLFPAVFLYLTIAPTGIASCRVTLVTLSSPKAVAEAQGFVRVFCSPAL